jgi:hypothetical protein
MKPLHLYYNDPIFYGIIFAAVIVLAFTVAWFVRDYLKNR